MTTKPEIQPDKSEVLPWMMEAGAQIMREYKSGTHYPDRYTEAFATIIAAHCPPASLLRDAPKQAKYTSIDEFVAKLESTPKGKAAMNEAREWLHSQPWYKAAYAPKQELSVPVSKLQEIADNVSALKDLRVVLYKLIHAAEKEQP
jgi:hypothetical protein